MTKQRIKVPLAPAITINSRAEAEQTMNSLAASVSAKRKLAAEMDAKILAIQKSYETGFDVLNKAIEARTDALRVWADTNPEQFPKGRKSIEFVSGLLGFRTGTPKLALLNRSWTWDKVLATLKVKTAFSGFVRHKEEVDKEKILAQHAAKQFAELDTIGCKVVQEESFFVEPNLTDTEAKM